MPKKKATTIDLPPSSKRMTLEGREQQLIALAYDLVEQRLRDGTATSQETTHFLRLGSTREKREAEVDKKKLELMESKIDALDTARRIEALYSDAISAVNSYRSPVTSVRQPLDLTGT